MKTKINYFLKNSEKWEEKKQLCVDWLGKILKEFEKNKELNIENKATELLNAVKYKKVKSEFSKLIPFLQKILMNNEKAKLFDRLEVNSKDGNIFISPVTTISFNDESNDEKLKNLEYILLFSKYVKKENFELPEYLKLKSFLTNQPEATILLRNIFYDYEIAIKKQLDKTLEIFNDFKSIYNNFTKKQKDLIRKNNANSQSIISLLNHLEVSETDKENIQKQRGTINQYFSQWESKTMNFVRGQKQKFYETEFIIDNPDLKNHPYKKFSDNFRQDKSKRKQALRNIKKL